MNPAIMQLKITKTEQEKKLKDLELKLIMRLNDISSRVIPYFEQIEDIKAAEIRQLGCEILEIYNEALECKKKLKQVKEALGEQL